MSPSPEKDIASESADHKSSDVQVNSKKRSSSDGVEYPRRRATIAVCKYIIVVFVKKKKKKKKKKHKCGEKTIKNKSENDMLFSAINSAKCNLCFGGKTEN